VKATDPVEEAVNLMREKAVRRILVMDDGSPGGIVSIGDLALERDRQSALGNISAAPPNQ
jgi:predicted transcriptional regulator